MNIFRNLNVLRAIIVRDSLFDAESRGAIEDNILLNIEGRAAGAGFALFQSSNLQITGNSFTNLSFWALASQQEGGAIYTDSTTSNVTIKHNSFQQCRAKVGGALRLNNLFNQIRDNHFSANQATFYGSNLASIPTELKIMNYEDLPIQFQNASPHNLESRSLSSLQGIRSGGTVAGFYLVLVDQFGEIVTSSFNHYLTFILKAASDTTFTPNFESPSILTSSYGVFDLQNVIFFGEPDTSILLSASTDAIDLLLAGADSYYYEMNLEISFRPCISGESFTDDGRCEQCPPEKDLLSAPSSVTSCEKCPTNALCLGGNRVTPLPGFWRPHAQSLEFLSCFTSSACLGSSDSDYSPTGNCLEGYQGVLCAQCQPGFVRNSRFQCARCPQRWKNIVLLIFILLASVTAIVILIRLTLKTMANKNSGFSVFFKIISSHFQLILLAISLELEWPSSVKSLHSSIEPVANVASKIVSFDCFLGTQQEKVKNVYVYLTIYLLLPLVMIGGAILFWKLKYAAQRERACSRSVTTIIILFFLVHPSIASAIFSIFNCRAIDSKLHLLSDLDIHCYQGAHLPWALIGGGLGMILWVVGIPWLAWHFLKEHRLRLANEEVRERFGFLYNGYRLKRYYWESVVMFRKVIMIFISVFLRSQGTRIQALTVFLFLLFASIFTLKQKPYVNRKMNNLELLSLVTSCITIYCGFFYLSQKSSSDPGFDPSKDYQMEQESKWFFFCAILFANLAFIAAWTSALAQQLKGYCRIKYPSCYLRCCLCNRKDLLNHQLKLSKQENQLEDFVQEIEDISETLTKAKNKILDRRLFMDQKKFAAYIHYSKRILSSINLADQEFSQQEAAGKYRTQNPPKEKDSLSEMEFSISQEFSVGKSQNTELQFIETSFKRRVNASKGPTRMKTFLQKMSQDSSSGLILRNRLRSSSKFEVQSAISDLRSNKGIEKKLDQEAERIEEINHSPVHQENHQILSFFNSVEEVNPHIVDRIVNQPKSARILSSYHSFLSTSPLDSFQTERSLIAPQFPAEEEKKETRRPSHPEESQLVFYPRHLSVSSEMEMMSGEGDLQTQEKQEPKKTQKWSLFKQLTHDNEKIRVILKQQLIQFPSAQFFLSSSLT